jgi:signal transduction histidine kinase
MSNSTRSERSLGLDRDPEFLNAILANLSQEICQPLGLLRGGISQLVGSRADQLSEAERSQAQTLLTICDDLGRLTRETLGGDPAGRD